LEEKAYAPGGELYLLNILTHSIGGSLNSNIKPALPTPLSHISLPEAYYNANKAFLNLEFNWRPEHHVQISKLFAEINFYVSPQACALPCNNIVESGSDDAKNYLIELGSPSGSFTLDYNMFASIPDEINVYHDDKWIGGTGCKVGADSIWIDYSGNSTQVEVRVTPNCDGNTDGTNWNFTVNCH
jgi:hypothetical protein